ncbi:DUF6252 family protein [Flavobacterium gelatinilyticum]|uniref:DUF6252 family protein n=1 Tax=Flavobacterium gelatinilyticum TaxID=3003260 RepID=UPI002480469E|nr:DUF6252 family protein [Flavobacterium gelatinilyticum]
MRKNTILFLLLLAIGSFFSSCSGDFDSGLDLSNSENNGNGNVDQKGIFKAKVEGEEFTANTTQAIVSDNYVAITGFRSSKGDLIQMILPSNKVGTYSWANSQENAENFVLAYAEATNGYGFVSASNEDAAFLGVQNYTDTALIKITSVDKTQKTISGTFQFTGFREADNGSTEIKVVTSGVFTNIPYTENIPVDDSDDILKAKVDGVDFITDKIDVTSVSASGSNPYYSIVGGKNDGNSSIGLSIDKSSPVGTYQASDVFLNEGEDINVFGAYYRTNDVLYRSKSGSIKIALKTADKIEGTFNFVVQNFTSGDEKTLTGSFSINIEDL